MTKKSDKDMKREIEMFKVETWEITFPNDL